MNDPTPFPPPERGGAPAPHSRPTPPLIVRSTPDTELDLGGLLSELLGAWPLIALITGLSVLAAWGYSQITTPQYQATALLQIEPKGSVVNGLKDLSTLFAGGSGSETEIQLIESHSVLEKVVESQHLLITTQPVYFPVVGRAVARRWEARHATVAPPFHRLVGWAWGNETLRVDRFDVPADDQRRTFRLVAGSPGHFELLSPEGVPILQGEVGKLATGIAPGRPGPGGSRSVSILVSELAANAGTPFTVVRRTLSDAVGAVRSQLEVSEQGKDTGIVALSLKGEDPAQLRRILDDICQRYLRQDIEQKSAEADRTLQFVEGQLPQLKKELDRAEQALRNYQSRSGSVDFKMETQAVIDRSVDLERRLSELNLQRAELLQRYTPTHPSVLSLDKQIEELHQAQENVGRELRRLPDAELRSVQLTRAVRVANDMYVLLLTKAQELRIVKSGTLGNARVVDEAVVDATAPVWPKRNIVLVAGLMAGLLLGLFVAGIRRALDRGIEDPEVLETGFGVPVIATVPRTGAQRWLRHRRRKRAPPAVLAVRKPGDRAVESLRALRTGLQSIVHGPRSNVILVSGLRPGVGKSFVSLNLATLLGAGGQRVLLIDGDLRRGNAHQAFGKPRGPGLAEVAAGGIDVREAVVATDLPNVFLLPTGVLPPNPSELLLAPRFAAALAWASGEFDVVLVDAPPTIPVTDAAVIGKHVGRTLLVMQWGLHSPREIRSGLNRLAQANVQVTGFVMNAVPRRSAAYAEGGYGCAYP